LETQLRHILAENAKIQISANQASAQNPSANQNAAANQAVAAATNQMAVAANSGFNAASVPVTGYSDGCCSKPSSFLFLCLLVITMLWR